MKNLNGLSYIHCELTSRCNKSCYMCGRREIEKNYPEFAQNWGDMDFFLVEKIAKQVPHGIMIHFHNNGEPLLYPRLKEAIKIFKRKHSITHFDTNGKLLWERRKDLNVLNILTVSIINQDEEGDYQYEIVNKYLKYKKNNKPNVIFRMLGKFIEKTQNQWEELAKEHNIQIVTRTLHAPMGSNNYKNKVTVPEHGICLELLNHLAIDRYGNVSVCVRFDPNGELRLGNIKENTLKELWNSEKRINMIKLFKQGKRKEIAYCNNKCEYYGCPVS